MEKYYGYFHEYIKDCLIELACNDTIIHTYHSTTPGAASRLKSNVKQHGMEEGIQMTVAEIMRDKQFLEYMQTYELAEDKGDDTEYLQIELFEYFVEFVGLLEINGLHGNNMEKFRNEFYSAYLRYAYLRDYGMEATPFGGTPFRTHAV